MQPAKQSVRHLHYAVMVSGHCKLRVCYLPLSSLLTACRLAGQLLLTVSVGVFVPPLPPYPSSKFSESGSCRDQWEHRVRWVTGSPRVNSEVQDTHVHTHTNTQPACLHKGQRSEFLLSAAVKQHGSQTFTLNNGALNQKPPRPLELQHWALFIRKRRKSVLQQL